MAYDKHTWTCREPITAEKLNHMEDGIANAGGDCDCGFECTETVTTLTEESVTTTMEEGDTEAYADLSYSQFIDAESIKVTFNGTVYECEKTVNPFGGNNYGASWNDSTQAYDWSEYPFEISSNTQYRNTIATETAGTYSIKIEAIETTVTTTPCFEKARGYSCGEEMGVLTEESVTTTAQGSLNRGTLSYSQFIDADSIKVTFDGVEYECPRIASVLGNVYGGFGQSGPDFSEYPFCITSSYSSSTGFHITGLYTETAGTYTVKIEALKTNATITPCFEAAVKEANKGMGSIEVPTGASVAIVKRSSGITGSPYAVPANSSATVRFTFSESLSEIAALRQIIVPTGILLGKIQPLQSAYADVNVYNVTADSITLTNDNTTIEFIDFEEPEPVCVMMSDGCSSPGPSPA